MQPTYWLCQKINYVSIQREAVTWKWMLCTWGTTDLCHVEIKEQKINKTIKGGIILYHCEASVFAVAEILCKRYQILLGKWSSELTHIECFQFHCSRPIYGHTAFADEVHADWDDTTFSAAIWLKSVRLKRQTWCQTSDLSLTKGWPTLQKDRTEQQTTTSTAT